MAEFRHLFPHDTARAERYTYARQVSSSRFRTPPRDDRVGHGTGLVGQLEAAEQAHEEKISEHEIERQGIVLDFASDPGFKLQLQSLEMRRSGIELCNARTVDDVMHATVFVPVGKIGYFVKKFEQYTRENTETGRPRNKALVESIANVRLAALESFWTDAGSFSGVGKDAVWWEIWLRDKTNPHDVGEEFRAVAESVGIDVSTREIRFPERRVVLAKATVQQLTEIGSLFDLLAELRLAKRLASEFLELAPREQAELIQRTLARIEAPPQDAPAVCHLDTGVNRGHPLLSLAIDEGHVLACEPEWVGADIRGHGTEMAGLALYGCLTELFGNTDRLKLKHRLESVKILPDGGENEPDLYGDITNQGIYRAEIASPERNRAICLATTADGRDEGYPSSALSHSLVFVVDSSALFGDDFSTQLTACTATNCAK